LVSGAPLAVPPSLNSLNLIFDMRSETGCPSFKGRWPFFSSKGGTVVCGKYELSGC